MYFDNSIVSNSFINGYVRSYNVFTNNYVIGDATANGNYNTFENGSGYVSGIHNTFIQYHINGGGVQFSNFIDCPSPIVSDSGYYPYNYWGSAQTDELNIKGDKANISFIYDYYDSFDLDRIDYSNWANEPFEQYGYSETGFVAFDYVVNGYDFISGGYYPENTSTSLSIEINPQYHENPITQMRIAQTYEELKAASWTSYSSKTNFTMDKTKLVNGTATLYVQIKDNMGNCSSAVCHNIPYDIPVCYLSLEDGTNFGSTVKKQELRYHITDLGNITSYTLSLDGSRIASGSGNSWGTYAGEWTYQLPLAYMASGTHILKLTATDSAGNTGETSISFTINRDFDESSVKDISYNSTTGQFYKDSNTLHLWHLDNDGKEDSGTAEIPNYTHTNGGFEGSTSYLYGNISLDISTNAYTVEFWTRGKGTIDIEKYQSIRIHNSFYNTTSYDGYMYHYYETSDGITNSWIYSSAATRARSDDQWHYWAYVYDGTYTAIYCDGVCVSYQDDFTHTLNANNSNISISVNDGIVDEIRISSNARSADEINSYYQTAKPILDANTGSLEAIVW